jgi:hypothetical protein
VPHVANLMKVYSPGASGGGIRNIGVHVTAGEFTRGQSVGLRKDNHLAVFRRFRGAGLRTDDARESYYLRASGVPARTIAGTPNPLMTGHISTGQAVGCMSADLVGSERVRRHPHHRA